MTSGFHCEVLSLETVDLRLSFAIRSPARTVTMHPQLIAIVHDFELAQSQVDALAERVPDDVWRRRPSPESWSVAECVAHLNLTSRAMLPRLERAIEEAKRLPPNGARRYRRDPIGWMLWRTMGPPVRLKVSTTAAYVPTADADPRTLVSDFRELQQAQLQCVAAADGFAISKVRVVSPFAERVRYNLFAALGMLARHQLRHLWQAERASTAVLGGY